MSLEDDPNHSPQKDLFARYLFMRGHSEEQGIWREMEKHWRELNEDDRGSSLRLWEEDRDEKGKILSYFVSGWLRHMGLGSSKNRSYLLAHLKLHLGPACFSAFTKFYKHLEHLTLPPIEKRRLFLEICLNGWEHLVGWLVEDPSRLKLVARPSKETALTRLNSL